MPHDSVGEARGQVTFKRHSLENGEDIGNISGIAFIEKNDDAVFYCASHQRARFA
jgi:hypothetical protein